MPTTTPNLNLTKPSMTDNVRNTIPALATNFQKIDTEFSSLKDHYTQHQML